MDLGPGDLVSARRENCCPSAGNHLSAHREDDVSAVTDARTALPGGRFCHLGQGRCVAEDCRAGGPLVCAALAATDRSHGQSQSCKHGCHESQHSPATLHNHEARRDHLRFLAATL